MQYRTRRMERKLFVWFVAVLAAVSLVFSYSIPAWASDETSIELNQNISIGNVDVESVTSSGANPGNDGYVVSRVNFSATNAGSLAFYTRAKIDVLFYDSLGNLVSNLDQTTFVQTSSPQATHRELGLTVVMVTGTGITLLILVRQQPISWRVHWHRLTFLTSISITPSG